MNDLRTRRNDDAELHTPIIHALDALMTAAPSPQSEPTDANLLGRHEPTDHRSRTLVAAAAAGVLGLGVAGLVVTNQPDDPAVSQPGPQPSVSEPAASPPGTLAPPTAADVDDPLADLTGFVLPAHLPDGYEITNLNAMPVYSNQFDNTDTDAAPTEVGVATDIWLNRTDGQPGGFVSVTSLPHASNETLDSLLQDREGFERQQIGGIERNVRIQPPDALGPFTNIEWIEGDQIITVAGRATPNEVIAVAEGVAATSRDAFVAAGASITDSAAALDVLDEVTFADGTRVSVRSLTPGPSGSGAVAMCVDAPTQQCHFSFSETGIGGAYQDNLIAAFDIDGNTVLLVWHDTAEAERVGDPSLTTSGIVSASTIPSDEAAAAPLAPETATSTAEITEQIATDLGRFTRVDVPAGETPPQLTYETETGQIGLSTSAPSSYRF
ncbi:MAG: hypothetical protein ACE37B_20710 [Ilumatobacter sp.]|uniref:hypothetical protein n=1 Tax=Ilumatobacter sp. TaxID=1967498 RepID=UPI00391B7B2E